MELDQATTAAITDDVRGLLSQDKSGHGMEHVDRVVKLALSFAESERADKTVVALAALLHDVDDYKLFGQEHADGLLNARAILSKYDIDPGVSNTVLEIIQSMGYNKSLEGIRPTSLEGMIVSDADMCDAIGAIGIIRTHAYALSKGNVFFDKHTLPVDEEKSAEEYRAQTKTHAAQHFFDKLLKIPRILMTEAGRREGEKRAALMYGFLEELFTEEDAGEWLKHLSQFRAQS